MVSHSAEATKDILDILGRETWVFLLCLRGLRPGHLCLDSGRMVFQSDWGITSWLTSFDK